MHPKDNQSSLDQKIDNLSENDEQQDMATCINVQKINCKNEQQNDTYFIQNNDEIQQMINLCQDLQEIEEESVSNSEDSSYISNNRRLKEILLKDNRKMDIEESRPSVSLSASLSSFSLSSNKKRTKASKNVKMTKNHQNLEQKELKSLQS